MSAVKFQNTPENYDWQPNSGEFCSLGVNTEWEIGETDADIWLPVAPNEQTEELREAGLMHTSAQFFMCSQNEADLRGKGNYSMGSNDKWMILPRGINRVFIITIIIVIIINKH